MASERILIIDDSPVDARFASKILTEAGYTTTIIHDSEEAIPVVRQLRPDLILLDVTMPKVDGYQICQRLKSDPDIRDTCTVLYTIRDQFIDCLKGIEAGADDFIIKTLSAKDFLDRVKNILAERNRGPGGPTTSLDLTLIQPLAEMQDRQELFQLLYRSFNKHIRETMSVLLGSQVTSVLLDRAVEKAAARFPVFRDLDLKHVAGFMFDSTVLQDVSAMELIEWFQIFCDELYQLVMKLTRTRVNGAKEARDITKGFTDMVRELHAEYERLYNQATESASAGEPESPESGETPSKLGGRAVSQIAARALSPDCTLDSTGNIIYCNDDLVKVLDYEKSELIGRSFNNFLVAQSRQGLGRTLDRLVDQGSATVKLSLVAKDGTVVHTNARLDALYDSQGYFAMTRCALQVVPESMLIKEREEAIERLKQALLNYQEEYSALASTISHDLRQPLHAILLLCQFLQEEFKGKLEDQALEYIRSIEQAGTRLKKMVEDLVKYARITKDEIGYETVEMSHIVETVRNKLTDMLIERNANVHVVGGLPAVTCNREQIEELFHQLISNGTKFNQQPQPHIEIGLAKEDDEGLTFYVKDDGLGIEEAYHEAIFRLFHRLHTPEEYEGTGAGLAICRRIVEAHGGRIWVRSELGTGTTVFFTLPRELPSDGA